MTNRKPDDEVQHGTNAGYSWHMHWDKIPCEACRLAHNEILAARRAQTVLCKECGQEGRRGSRGRCSSCYSKWLYRNGHGANSQRGIRAAAKARQAAARKAKPKPPEDAA